MNGFERIMAVLNGKNADMPPIMLHNFMTAAEQSGFNMKQYRSDAKNMANSHIAMARKYGLDGVFLDVDTCLEAHAIGVPTDFPDDEPARACGSISTDIEFLLEKISPDRLHTDERIGIMLEAVRIMRKELDGETLLRVNVDQGPFSLAMLAYGMTDFMMDLLDEDLTGDILKLIDRCCDVHIEFHKLAREAGADITSFGDSSCGPDLLSAECYRTFAMPFHKRIKDELDNAGIKTICHICGNLDKILDDVAKVGFTGIEVDYKTNIGLAHKVLKGKSAVFGCIDPSGIFYFGSPEQVAAKTKEALDTFSGDGIVVGAGCALPRNTPDENIRAYVQAARTWQG
ncbi:MAG: hypothetical protein FWG94_06575 [Oscillospiraceae bacterium]|nr:hypothetical protein [Oscillospiraceae bacterium]